MQSTQGVWQTAWWRRFRRRSSWITGYSRWRRNRSRRSRSFCWSTREEGKKATLDLEFWRNRAGTAVPDWRQSWSCTCKTVCWARLYWEPAPLSRRQSTTVSTRVCLGAEDRRGSASLGAERLLTLKSWISICATLRGQLSPHTCIFRLLLFPASPDCRYSLSSNSSSNNNSSSSFGRHRYSNNNNNNNSNYCRTRFSPRNFSSSIIVRRCAWWTRLSTTHRILHSTFSTIYGKKLHAADGITIFLLFRWGRKHVLRKTENGGSIFTTIWKQVRITAVSKQSWLIRLSRMLLKISFWKSNLWFSLKRGRLCWICGKAASWTNTISWLKKRFRNYSYIKSSTGCSRTGVLSTGLPKILRKKEITLYEKRYFIEYLN